MPSTANTVRPIALLNAFVIAVGILAIPMTRLEARPAGDLGHVDGVARADLSPRQEALMGELEAWLTDTTQLSERVPDAIRERAESFALLRDYPGAEARTALLADIPFGTEIEKAARKHGLDPLLVASVVEVESHFKARAGSHKGAVGLMQLLPSTAGLPVVQLYNPVVNLDAGAGYLAEMIERFDGDLELALAAYNAGPTNVRRHEGVPPFPETQGYVVKVLGRYVDHYREIWQAGDQTAMLAELAAHSA